MRWRSPLPLFLSLSCLAVCVSGATDFRICAFSLQKFDSVKAADGRTMHTLLKVVSRCDICLLQEVIDPDGKIVTKLMASLNRYSANRYDEYTYKAVSSKSMGDSSDNMQKYVFIYREETVNVTGTFQYEKKNSFVRAPYAIQVQSKKTALKQFSLVSLHAEGKQAVSEMDRLYDVFEDVSKKWNDTNVMFLGDFHAGCAHMSKKDKKKIRLFKSKFSWLIGDKVDTTVNEDYPCPYDRMVVHGSKFLKAIHPYSAKVFNYGKELKLSRTKVLALSDHFPIEVRLKSHAPFLQATPIMMMLLLTVQSALSIL